MDSLTHALAASAAFAVAGRPELIPFAALGAIAPDVDIAFQRFSDRDPRLDIFTHGGITHSLAGAVALSLLVALVAIPVTAFAGYGLPLLPAIGAIVVGALSHVLLDFLAYPGIPLLYPATDHKYTLGITAGPTPYMLVASIAFGVSILADKASMADPWIYAGFFALLIGLSGILKIYVSVTAGGTAIPGFNPLHWLIIAERPSSYRVFRYHLLKGSRQAVDYEKVSGMDSNELGLLKARPEARRMRYHSYIVTAARDGETIVLSDPIREHGYLWYPPYYKRLAVAGAPPGPGQIG